MSFLHKIKYNNRMMLVFFAWWREIETLEQDFLYHASPSNAVNVLWCWEIDWYCLGWLRIFFLCAVTIVKFFIRKLILIVNGKI